MSETSIRDDIVAAINAQSDGVQAEQTITPSAPDTSPTPEPSAEPQSQGESRAATRGPDGKFVKSEADDSSATQTQKKSDQPVAQTDATTQQSPQYPGWTAEMKVEFQKMPDNVRKYILDREKEFDRKIGSKGSETEKLTKFSSEFEQVVAPYRDRIAMAGSTPIQQVKMLLAAEDALQRSPVQAIQHLARSYGVDLRQFGQQTQPQQPQVPQELAPLYQEIGALRQHVAQQQDNARQQTEAQIYADLDAFSAQAEHLKDVETEMVPWAQHIRLTNPSMSNSEVLKQAYDKACWANPHVRQLMQSKSQDDAEAKRRSDAALAAKEAQRKAVGITGSPSGMPVAEQGDSIRDDIMKAWRKHRA